MFFSHFISNRRRGAGGSCPSFTWNKSYVLWISLVLRLSSVLRTRPLLHSEGLRQVVTSELERLERLLTVVSEEECPVDYLNSVRSSKVSQFPSVLALRLFQSTQPGQRRLTTVVMRKTTKLDLHSPTSDTTTEDTDREQPREPPASSASWTSSLLWQSNGTVLSLSRV